MTRFGKFRERPTSKNKRRYRLIRRELDSDDEDDFELVPCVCGEKR